MKYVYLVLALVFILRAVPASTFESKNPEREERRLKIELEAAPSQVQQDFDKYVQELAAVARRDVDSPPEKKDRIKELQAKALNPVVLFRW
ncbi:MAG: hypothetical protein ACREP3_06970 [Candidatus Binatia bacterium]